MMASVREFLRISIEAYPEMERPDWVLKWPGQVVIAGCQTYWSKEVEEAIIAKNMKGKVQIFWIEISDFLNFDFKKFFFGRFDDPNKNFSKDFCVKVNKDLMDLVGLVRGKLTNLERMIMSALIVIEVHARDVTEGKILENLFSYYFIRKSSWLINI